MVMLMAISVRNVAKPIFAIAQRLRSVRSKEVTLIFKRYNFSEEENQMK